MGNDHYGGLEHFIGLIIALLTPHGERSPAYISLGNRFEPALLTPHGERSPQAQEPILSRGYVS